MPWQGDPEVLIDRFDGRAHLDFIGEFRPGQIPPGEKEPDPDAVAATRENREINYERYRILVQNDFLKGGCPTNIASLDLLMGCPNSMAGAKLMKKMPLQ